MHADRAMVSHDASDHFRRLMPRTCLLLQRRTRRGIYPGRVLDLSSFDLEEIGNALADQTGYEHRWLIDPRTGEIAFWTADTGIDGQTPVDLDDLDLVWDELHEEYPDLLPS